MIGYFEDEAVKSYSEYLELVEDGYAQFAIKRRSLYVVQHTDSEYLGLIEDHLEGRSIGFSYMRPHTTGGKLPATVKFTDGLVLLGGPLADEDELTGGAALLGSEGFVRGFLTSKLEKFEAFLAGLERTAEEGAPHLPRAQSGNLLLWACGLGRLTHLTRLLPPAATADFAAAACHECVH